MDKEYYTLCFNNLANCLTVKRYDIIKSYLQEIIQNSNNDLIKCILIKLIEKMAERKRFIYLNCNDKTFNDKYNVCSYLLIKFVFDNIIKWCSEGYICAFECHDVLKKLS